MPLLSSKGKYGLAALCEIKKHTADTPISKKEIAKKANIPSNYLDQLLTKLRAAGFIKSTRGSLGGYILALPAEDIELLDVLIALEGELKVINDLEEETLLSLYFDDVQSKINSIFKIKLSQLSEYGNKFLHYQI